MLFLIFWHMYTIKMLDFHIKQISMCTGNFCEAKTQLLDCSLSCRYFVQLLALYDISESQYP